MEERTQNRTQKSPKLIPNQHLQTPFSWVRQVYMGIHEKMPESVGIKGETALSQVVARKNRYLVQVPVFGGRASIQIRF